MLDWWESQPFTTLWVDGNHENFDLIEKYNISEWRGGHVQFIRPHIIHLMRGQIYDICNHNFFVMGGATSIDRIYRIPHTSWWEQEMPTYEEMNEGFKNLERYNFCIGYVLTHCAPTRFLGDIFKGTWFDTDPLNRYLNQIEQKLTYKKWYFGHYHIDKSGEKWRTLYDDVIEIA